MADLRDMLADARALIECESPSSDLAAVGRSADVVAEVGAGILGAAPERIVIDGRTHLRWRLGESEPRVLLLGHHDTVWPIGTLAGRPFAVESGILRGPGCFDMKIGLVMALHAAAGLDGVTLLVTGDEEIGSPSSRALIEEEAKAAAAALVLEASVDGHVKCERKGVSLYEVRVAGRAAHAGLEPERGVNATVELAHQVLAVSALADPATGTTVTPTVARSGVTTNTVPAESTFAVDVRAGSVTEQERVDRAMRSLWTVDPRARIETAGGVNRPPLEASASDGLYATLCRIAVARGLPVPGRAAVGGASDGNFTAGVGTPTLDGLGAVGGGAHADDEHVVIGEITPRTALLRALVEHLLVSQ
ncbi:M20/M25/M40 family metallo-hydrolase [Cryptosporangium arvum]|uniref:Acetylornithine deacetylase/succinyldiaminopimelate desuccinylase-like deacylase n=1 Tax=Cryptosporangium arvum DSM 44712 TaxID=927661 RepID=A0A010ZVZ5_9ACTN|nr:M20/M25/M40 family metallo-hydrolase [Cryptosporangium arvum]EXG82839.1 acetylornithine deacetylase/succinyldiaminopimelate desuccinylase-like deacylase [Cryptosporangium arvum DSM 44712]